MSVQNNEFDRLSTEFLGWFNDTPDTRVHPDISIADFRRHGRGRGVIATTDIAIGEVLFSLPLRSTLSFETSHVSRCVPSLKDLPDWLRLVAALLYEHGLRGQSRWCRYLQLLPDEFDTLVHWSETELQELRGCAVLDKVAKSFADEQFKTLLLPILRNYHEYFNMYKDVLIDPDSEAAVLQILHRMATLIMSYSFDLAVDTDTSETASINSYATEPDEWQSSKHMVPFADLLNADAARNNASLWQENGQLQMLTIKPIASGEEIFNDYGELPRSDLLRRYGYITENYKIYDEVEVYAEDIIRLVRNHSQLQQCSLDERQERARQWDVDDTSFALGKHIPGRTDFFDSKLLLFITAYTGGSKLRSPTPSREDFMLRSTETQRILKDLLLERQSQYMTTIAEDNLLLRNDDVKGRIRMAVEVRLGEKTIISEALARLKRHQTRLNDLSPKPEVRLEQKAERLGDSPETVSDTIVPKPELTRRDLDLYDAWSALSERDHDASPVGKKKKH